MDITLRLIIILLFIIRYIYWRITEKRANQDKTKIRPKNATLALQSLQHDLLRFGYVVLLLQLSGVSLFPISFRPFWIEVIGFCIAMGGFCLAMAARRDLDMNWTQAREKQIKQKYTLITKGVYAYVRHPIYSGMLFLFVGAEMVANSYLYIPVFLFGVCLIYFQARREEKILVEHFGNEYKSYTMRTKMFIPGIF